MQLIPLTKGLFAQVDDEDFEWLSQWKWCVNHFYAMRIPYNRETGKNEKVILMHRIVAKTPSGIYTDHINGNKLDNRRNNLRHCTISQNCQNSKKLSGTINTYKGTWFDISRGKWRARIEECGKRHFLGSFETEREAAQAYNLAAHEYFGEFANINFAP